MSGRPVLLLDPMLATGGSAVEAVKVLVDKGARLVASRHAGKHDAQPRTQVGHRARQRQLPDAVKQANSFQMFSKLVEGFDEKEVTWPCG